MSNVEPRRYALHANGIAQHVYEWPGPLERTVVLFHGYLDHGWSFARVAAALASAGHRVLAPDFRGHGQSGWVPEGGYYHFADYVGDVTTLLAQLAPVDAVPKYSLVGHSMGGTVATMLAGTFPDRVRALALVEGVGPPSMPAEVAPDRMRKWLEDLGKPRLRERRRLGSLTEAIARLRVTHGGSVPDDALLEVASHLTVPHPSGRGLAWHFDPLHQSTSPLRFDVDAFESFARRIAAPVLLLDAGASGMRFDGAEKRRYFFLRQRVVTMDGAGHMIHWTEPGRLALELISFLQDVGA